MSTLPVIYPDGSKGREELPPGQFASASFVLATGEVVDIDIDRSCAEHARREWWGENWPGVFCAVALIVLAVISMVSE